MICSRTLLGPEVRMTCPAVSLMLPAALGMAVTFGTSSQVPSSPDSLAESVARQSAARVANCLKPLRDAHGVPLRTGNRPAWDYWGEILLEELTELQEEDSENSFPDLFPRRREDKRITSTCTQERSIVCQEVNAEPQVVPRGPTLTKDTTGEPRHSSEFLSPVQLAEQQSVSHNPQCWDTPPKETEWEEEELPGAEGEGEGDSNPQGTLHALLKEKEGEAGASGLDKDLWDKGSSKLLPIPEPEQCSDFSASPSSGSPCEERGNHQLPEQTSWGKLMSTGPEDASKHLLNIEAEELEKLEEDILSSMDPESSRKTYTLWDPFSLTLAPVAGPSVPPSLCCLTKDCAGEMESYTQLVPPDPCEEQRSIFNNKDALSRDSQIDQLLPVWEEEDPHVRDTAGEGESETDGTLSLSLQDKEVEPSASPLDTDPCDRGHSVSLPTALPMDTNMFSVLPVDPRDEANAADMESGCAQAAYPQEERCRAGACPVPAQALPYIVPAGPTGSAAVPQPPAPRTWRSMAKRARRALRRLLSFNCLRRQPEE
ncbi:hypothetical protein TURU_058928 [Turdus rufiventris]|nr:hypothetical protein TURU_058928 [Turdus rufiventris]